ncbi:MAG: hypothetical protein GXO26_02065 [Crenarchaeota archaeon]|nr:hypothetical protein [Thermoproteota archaeon]
MSLEREVFIRGRTHVETVYLTLLHHVLNSPNADQAWNLFVKYFIDYVYKSVIVPKIISDKTGDMNRHFRMLVERSFKYKFGNRFELLPDFVNSERDPYDICVDFLSSKVNELFPQDVIMAGDADRLIHLWCSEVIYTASMSFLQELKLIR